MTTLDSLQSSMDELLAKADAIEVAANAQAKATADRATVAIRQVEASDRRTKALRLLVIVGFIASAAVLAGVIFLVVDNRQANAANERAIAENNLKWCPLLGAIIQPQGPPPSTERSQQMVNLLSDLFVQYGCTPGDLPK